MKRPHCWSRPSLRPARSARLSLLVAAIATSLAGCSDPDPIRERPNVVFISVDTLRADRTTPYGYARDTSPALAKMAAEGTLFERAYSMSSWTLPSMSMLLSGEVKPLADVTILPIHESIGESFKNAGYRTCGVVGNSLLDADYGYDRGYDHYVLSEAEDEFSWTADRILGTGLEWLASTDDSDAPYFLWLHPVDPHAPYSPEGGNAFPDPLPDDPSRENARTTLAAQYERGLERADPSTLTDGAWRKIQTNRNRYDSEILQFDRALARLFEVLEERGELDNTIVVVTSDHGEGLWQRATNADENIENRNAVFPGLYDGHGAQVFDEQVRVPLIFRGPGVPKNVRISDPVDLVDVVPSVLALADVSIKRQYPGAPLFEGGEAAAPSADPVVVVCSRVSAITVDGRWRLHVPRDHRLKKDGVSLELYDLQADPFELSPIDDVERMDEMHARLIAWEKLHAPDGLRTKDIALDQALFLKLHQLGYGGEADHVKEFVRNLEEKLEKEREESDGNER